MSRQISYSSAITLTSVSHTNGTNAFNESTSYPISNAYTNSDDTTRYAYLTLQATANITCQVYFNFDSYVLSSIPDEATINSVTGRVRYYINNTTRVSSIAIQLYSDTTPKGTPLTTKTTTQTQYNLTAGTWSVSEIRDMRLLVSATRNNSASNTARVNFYGSDVTINYTVSGLEYEVTITNSTTATTSPSGTTYVFQGEDQNIRINLPQTRELRVTDNGSIVNPVQYFDGSLTANPSSFIATPSSTTTNGENGYNPSTNTSVCAQLRGTSNTSNTTKYYFDIDIPNGAIINSVSCSFRARSANGTSGTYIGRAKLMAGGGQKGSEVTINSNATNGAVYLIDDSGSWTQEELAELNLHIAHPSGANRYVYFYGADLVVNYSSPVISGETPQYCIYTISNISADHTIALSDIVKYSVSITSDEETLGGWVVYGDTWAGYSYNIPQGENCVLYIVGVDGEDSTDAPLNVSATDNGVDITNSIIYHAADDFLGIAYYEYSINNIQTAHTINLSYSSEPIASAYTVSVSTDYNYAFCSATVRYESGAHTVVVQPTQDIPVGDNCEVRINIGDSDAPQTGYALTDNGVDVTSSLVYVPQGEYEWSTPYYIYSLTSVRTAHTFVARYTGTTYTVSATTTNENLWFISYDLDGGDYEEVHLPEASCKVNPGGGTTILIGGSNFNGLRVTDNGTDVTSSLVYVSAETFDDITYSDGYQYDISNIQTNHTIVVSQTISENVVSAELADYYLFLAGWLRYNNSNAEAHVVTAGDSCELRVFSQAVYGTTYQSVSITTLQPYIIVTDNGVDISSSLSYHSPQYASDQEYLYYTLSNVQIGHTFIITYTGTTYTITASSTDNNHGIAFSGRFASASQYAIAYPGTNNNVFITGSTSDIYLTDNGVDVTSLIVTSNVTYYPVNVIQTNHTIVLSRMPQNTLSVKTSGTWQTVTKAYKKNGNSWVEQSDLTDIFDTTTIYFNE